MELKGTFVSLGLDESSDTINDKQLEIHVRYYNESKRELVTDFLERKYTAHPNAEEISDPIVRTLNEFGIKLNQVMGLMTDSPNVMKGNK